MSPPAESVFITEIEGCMKMRTKFAMMSLLLVSICAANASTFGPVSENERLQFADGLFSREMYELSIQEYGVFIRDFSDSKYADVAHFRLADCFLAKKDYKQAAQEYTIVFNIYTNSPYRLKAGFKRASVFLETGLNKEAVSLFSQVLALNPDEEVAAPSMYYLAEAQLKSGATNDAVKVLEIARGKYPASKFTGYSLLKLGEVYAGQPEKIPQAVEMFKLAAEKPVVERTGAEALFQLADMYFRQKQYDKSGDHYKLLLNRYPTDKRSSEARLQAAWALQNSGLPADALALAGEALKSVQADAVADWLYLKANSQRQLMKHAESIDTYQKLIKDYSDSKYVDDAQYETALVYYKTGDFLSVIHQVGRIRPGTSLKKEVYWLLAESNSLLGKRDEAIQYYKLLADSFPGTDAAADSSYRIAHLLSLKGEMLEAARYFSDIAVKYPTNSLAGQALFAAACAYDKANRTQDAIKCWGEVAKTYQTIPLAEDALYHKAMAEVRVKRDVEALASLQELGRRYPASRFMADSYFWQGVLKKDKGDAAASAELLKKSLAANPRQELEREASFQLAVALYKTAKYKEAADLMLPLLKTPCRMKMPAELLQWLSEYAFQNNLTADSIDAAAAIKEMFPDPKWQQTGWALGGRGFLLQGRLDEAETCFIKALAAKANTRFLPESALKLGDMMYGRKNLDEAVRYYTIAAETASDEALLGVRANAYLGLARAYKIRKEYESSAKYYMSIAILYDDKNMVPEALFEAGELYSLAGNSEAGSKARQELVERYPDSEWAKRLNKPQSGGSSTNTIAEAVTK